MEIDNFYIHEVKLCIPEFPFVTKENKGKGLKTKQL